MAISKIAIPQKVVSQEGSSGGGGIGGILGAIGAAAAVIGTGGLALPAAIGAIGAGASLGGLVGGVVAPGQKGGSSAESIPAAQSDNAISRRFAQQSQENVQSSPQVAENINQARAQLTESWKAVQSAPQEVKEQYGPTIAKAMLKVYGKEVA